METRLVQCAVCGAEIDLVTNQCPYCVPAEAPAPAASSPPALPAPPPAPQAPPAPAPAVSAAPAPEALTAPRTEPPPPPAAVRAAAERPTAVDDRALGLALFEAEECLARGSPDKALVLASRAVKDRPDSLTARSLLDRARREMLRGRRREKLEARVKEAQGLHEHGDFTAAERIVTSVLKLVPDHPVALDLFVKLKERRLKAGTVEAEAEKEIEALSRADARRALDAARSALAAGWTRRALLALRRGLRVVPDDPELLALLRELQRSAEALAAERSRRHALLAQIRAGSELLEQGRVEEGLRILEAVLREDPNNARVQAAIQAARRAWLASHPEESPAAAPPTPAPLPQVEAVPTAPPMVVRPPAPAPRVAPEPVTPLPPPPIPRAPAPIPRSPALRPAPRPSVAAPTREAPAIPPEIMLPRTRRRATPMALVLGGGLLLSAIVVFVAGRGGSAPHRAAPAPEAPRTAPAGATMPATEEPSGPLAGLGPPLKSAVQATLVAYVRALEAGDATALERARPDMSAAQREQRLSPFLGALNAATDVRVLDVALGTDTASVTILSTDVIVGGKVPAGPPLEETLHFARDKTGAWVLRATSEATSPDGR